MNNQNHRWTFVRGTIISLTTPGPNTDDNFLAFAKDIAKPTTTTCLALAIGTATVSSKQRKMVADALNVNKIPCAAISDDSIVRGLITAVSWLGVNIKAFSWAHLEDAIAFLNVPAPWDVQVREAAQELERKFQWSAKQQGQQHR